MHPCTSELTEKEVIVYYVKTISIYYITILFYLLLCSDISVTSREITNVLWFLVGSSVTPLLNVITFTIIAGMSGL